MSLSACFPDYIQLLTYSTPSSPYFKADTALRIFGRIPVASLSLCLFREADHVSRPLESCLYVLQLANQPQTKVEDLQACLKEWESSYTASAKTECSGKWKLHADFIHSTYQSIVLGVIHRQAQQAELAQQSSRAEADKATSQLQQVLPYPRITDMFPKRSQQTALKLLDVHLRILAFMLLEGSQTEPLENV